MLEKDLWRKLKNAFKSEPLLELRRIENMIGSGMPDVLFTHHLNDFSYHGFIELKITKFKAPYHPLMKNILDPLQLHWFNTQPNSWVMIWNKAREFDAICMFQSKNRHIKWWNDLDNERLCNFVLFKLDFYKSVDAVIKTPPRPAPRIQQFLYY